MRRTVAFYGPFGWIFSAYVLACAASAMKGYRLTPSESDNYIRIIIISVWTRGTGFSQLSSALTSTVDHPLGSPSLSVHCIPHTRCSLPCSWVSTWQFITVREERRGGKAVQVSGQSARGAAVHQRARVHCGGRRRVPWSEYTELSRRVRAILLWLGLWRCVTNQPSHINVQHINIWTRMTQKCTNSHTKNIFEKIAS
jgi:hypothetical protein